jgi:hypothetical protein
LNAATASGAKTAVNPSAHARRVGDRATEDVGEQQDEHDRLDAEVDQLERSVPVRVSSTDAYWPVSPMIWRTWWAWRTTSYPPTVARRPDAPTARLNIALTRLT